MYAHTKHNLVRLMLWIALSMAAFGVANAQPTVFTYQGKLTEAGSPASGPYQMQFKLFDALSAGAQIGPTITDVPVAVTQGIFTVKLDFEANAFSGANRWLEIAVRRNSGESYVTLSPRELIASSPYAVRTLSAASADVATNALNLGGVAANQFVQTNDPRLSDERDPRPNSPNYIQNNPPGQQPSSSFRISGNGAIGGNLAIGVASTTSPYRLDVAGPLRAFSTGAADINVQTFGGTNAYAQFRMTTPNRRWLMGTSQNFNGDQFYLIDDTAAQFRMTIQPNNGPIAFPSGSVGIGTSTPVSGKLHVNGGNETGIYAFSSHPSSGYGVFGDSVNGWGVFGRSANGAGVVGTSGPWIGVYGESQNYQGVHGKSVNNVGVVGVGNVLGGVYGESVSGNAVWGRSLGSGFAVFAEGNVGQTASNFGLPKAMMEISLNGLGPASFVKCFNGVANQGGASCGINIFQPGGAGPILITFPFRITDRYLLLTPKLQGPQELGLEIGPYDPNDLLGRTVYIYLRNGIEGGTGAGFYLIVY